MTRDHSQDRDRNAADPAAPSPPGGSLGGWLRAQREARGVSLRDIADASKISLRYLEALEQDRLEVLPAPIFTKGFLREYARVVGLDPDEVVNLYLLAAGETAREPAGSLPDAASGAAVRAGRGPTGPSPLGYGLLLVLAVVVFLAVAALLSIWASRRDRPGPLPESPRPAAAVRPEPPPASEPAPPAEAPAPPVAPVAETAPPTPAASGPRAEPSPPPASGPIPTSTAAAPLPAASAPDPTVARPLRLVLEFTQDCWVELVVDGQRRTSELRTAGEVVALEAREFVLLTLGNTPGVRVEVDGRPFALPGGPSRVVRDLRIDRTAAGSGSGPSTGP